MTKELIESSREHRRLHATSLAFIAAALVFCIAVAAIVVSIGISRAEGIGSITELARAAATAARG